MSVGRKLLTALIDSDKGLGEFIRLGVTREVFAGPDELALFELVSDHVKHYGKMPSRETCTELGAPPLYDSVAEPPAFYYDRCSERYVFHRLRSMLKDVETKMNADAPKDALDRMMEEMTLCQMFLNRQKLFSYVSDSLDVIRTEYHLKLNNPDHGLKLGWPTFDKMTAGLTGGDLVTILGRPGMGKTYIMLYAALVAWRNGLPPLFVSMEMKPLPIIQRLVAIDTKTPITPLKKADLEPDMLTDVMSYLHDVKNKPPFWIIDGGLTSTIDELTLYCQQLKPGVVFVDGAYLLRNSNPKISKWEKNAENAERLKQDIATQMDIPTIISYQYNRKVSKKTKQGEAGLEDIAYTDAIGQLSSVVLGLLQIDSVETLTKRRVEILKGRSGESGDFEINWNFDQGPNYMDFSEVQSSLGELTHI
jgi:replicative DNA helicase